MCIRDRQKAGATALAVTGLDCVGWLLNLRARDLPCTPLAVAYAPVSYTHLSPSRISTNILKRSCYYDCTAL